LRVESFLQGSSVATSLLVKSGGQIATQEILVR